MANNKGLKMQKARQLKVVEYSGSCWYGEVYEAAPNWWAWSAGVELGDRANFEGVVGYKTEEVAYQALKIAVAAMLDNQGETILHILANQSEK